MKIEFSPAKIGLQQSFKKSAGWYMYFAERVDLAAYEVVLLVQDPNRLQRAQERFNDLIAAGQNEAIKRAARATSLWLNSQPQTVLKR